MNPRNNFSFDHCEDGSHKCVVQCTGYMGGILARVTEPPPGPSDWDMYLIVAPAIGGFAGKEDQLAYWVDDKWYFCTPHAGAEIWLLSEKEHFIYKNNAWCSMGDRNVLFVCPGDDIATKINNAPECCTIQLVPDITGSEAITTWETSTTLLPKWGQTIQGAGRFTVIKWAGANNAPLFELNTVSANVEFVAFRQLMLRGNHDSEASADGNYGIYLNQVGRWRQKEVRLEGVEIGYFYTGLKTDFASPGFGSTLIRDCYFYLNAHLQIDSLGRHSSIRGLNLHPYYSNANGIYLKNPHDIRISDLYILGTKGDYDFKVYSDAMASDGRSDLSCNSLHVENAQFVPLHDHWGCKGLEIEVALGKVADSFVFKNIEMRDCENPAVRLKIAGTLTNLNLEDVRVSGDKPTYGIDVDATCNSLHIAKIANCCLGGTTKSLRLRTNTTIDRLLNNDLTGGIEFNGASIKDQEHNKGFVDRIYGLAGQGLQNMINLLPAAGGTVILPNEYLETLTTAITPRSNLSIICPSRNATLTDGANLTLGMIIAGSTQNVLIDGIKFIGNDSDTVGIGFASAWNFKLRWAIRRCHFYQCHKGVARTANYPSHILIDDCYFEDCIHSGVYPAYVYYWHIRNCTFNGGWWGISEYGDGNNDVIEDCVAIGCTTAGFRLYSRYAYSVSICSHCIAYNCAGYGFQVTNNASGDDNKSGPIFQGCVAAYCQSHGFFINGGGSATKVYGVQLIGCKALANSRGGAGTCDGFHIGAHTARTSLIGCHATRYPLNHQRYGFCIVAGAEKTEVRGGRWYPNQTGAFLDMGTESIIDCRDN